MMFKPTMKDRMKNTRARLQSGNAIVMLFAAIGMAGVVGYGLNTIMRGPGVTAAEVSRRTIAENNLVASTRLAISMAAKNPATHGDCDGDGFVEPIEFRAGPGTAGSVPLGGGFLPMSVGASMTDPWGTQYGYCVWDPGTIRTSDNNTACGGSAARRLNGSPRDDQPAIAVISAGKNGVFETQCNAYVDTTPADGAPDTPMIVKPTGSDDVVLSYTYAEANGVGAGEWKIDKAMDPSGETASINKDLTVGGGASFTGSLNAAKGLILPQDPGDNSITGACDEAHSNQLRLNTTSNPPTMEICNFAASTGWVPVSGTGGATTPPGVTNPSCIFQPLAKVGYLYADSSIAHIEDSKLWSFTNSGGSGCYSMLSTLSTPTSITTNYSLDDDCAKIKPDNVVFSGNYFYALGNNRVSVFDKSPATQFNYMGTVVDSTKLGTAYGLAVLDPNHVVATSDANNSLSVLDVSNPAAPTITGTVQDNTWLAGANTVLVSGTYAYVNASNKPALTVVNLSNPAAPVVVGHVDFPFEVLGMKLFNSKYVIAVNSVNSSPRMLTVDVSNPTAPVIAANTSFPTALDWSGNNFSIVGKYIFAVAHSSHKISIFDLSDPLVPLLVQKYSNSTAVGDEEGEPVISGHYMYIPTVLYSPNNAGIYVYNLGCDPLTGELDTGALGEVQAAPNPDRLDQNMIAHWPMDEGTGTVVGDTAGANPGAFVTPASTYPIWGPAGPNGASSLNFNMINRSAVKVTGLLGSPHTGTISLWVNATAPDTGGSSNVFSMGDHLLIDIGPTKGVSMTYYSGSYYPVISYEDIMGTGWHYITGTFDDVNNVFRIYVDGVLKREETYTNDITWAGLGGDTYIGRHGNGDATYDFDGSVDDVRVYNVALGPSEVKELYRRMKANSIITHMPPVTAANTYAQQRLAKGAYHACALKADNSLWCWGEDSRGSLGDGVGVTPVTPSPIRIGTAFYTSVTGRYGSMCAIRIDGTAWCWGANDTSQLGIGGFADTFTPTQVTGSGTWAQLSAGKSHTCGIKSDGTAWCWGDDGSGQLGNGATTGFQSAPSQVAGTGSWAYIAAGETSTCGIKTDGTAWCWGDDSSGQLGNGATTGNQASPSQVTDPGPWANISPTTSSACGVKTDGSAWCWGTENNGDLGNGSLITAVQTSPSRVNSLEKFSYVSAANNSACGVTVSGKLLCWGGDGFGQGGNGPSIIGDQPNPYPVVGASGWTSVGVSMDSSTCGNKADGSLWCWGTDDFGQLGNGPVLVNSQETPTPVIGFVNPPIFSWNDAASIILGNPGYNMALGIGFMTDTAGIARGFGFTGAGKAGIVQTVDPNQLLLETTLASSSSQISLKTAQNVTATDYTTNLVAKWALDDATGSATTTSAPGAFVGTLNNGPAWMPSLGHNGGSLYFDGVNDSVTVPNNASLRPASASGMTVAAWIKLDGPQAVNAKIIEKTYSNHGGPIFMSYALGMGNAGEPIQFETGYSGGADVLKASVPANYIGWMYVVGTFNSSASAPQKKIYINGVLSASKTLTSAIVYDSTAAGNLFIGRNGGNLEGFKGQIDDVRIYNADLTAAQVAQLYAYQTSLYQVPRTIGVDGLAANNFQISRNNATASNWLSAIATPDLNITPAGLVGVGTASPVVTMDVAGAVRIGADYECSAAGQAGKIRYVAGSSPPWQYCNGTTWTNFTPAVTATAKWKRSRYPEAFGGFEGVNCGVKADGTMWCWGYDAYNIGTGAAGHAIVSTPVQVGTDTGTPGWSDWVTASASYVDTGYTPYGQGFSGYGIRSNGTLWAWGGNDAGQLGIGTTVAHNRPVQVKDAPGTGFYTDWKAISGGEVSACGLRANGQIYCWGDCWNGACGDNNGANHTATLPVLVTDTAGSGSWSDWVQVTVGHDTACGIRASGVAYCWGNGDSGATGNNTGVASATPKIVLDDTGTATYWSDWKYLSMGNWVGCGLRANGQIYCWGANTTGALGDGTTGGGRLYPHKVVDSSGSGGWSDWVSVSLRTATACGVRVDGSAWCWGLNDNTQIGNQAAPGNAPKPYQVLGTSATNTCSAAYTDWVSINTGWGQVCGVRANGDAYCWGANDWGAFGNGTSGNILGCPQLVTNP